MKDEIDETKLNNSLKRALLVSKMILVEFEYTTCEYIKTFSDIEDFKKMDLIMNCLFIDQLNDILYDKNDFNKEQIMGIDLALKVLNDMMDKKVDLVIKEGKNHHEFALKNYDKFEPLITDAFLIDYIKKINLSDYLKYAKVKL